MLRTRLVLVAVLAGFLSGCGSVTVGRLPDPASDDAVADVSDAFQKCLADADSQLDDGKSNPMTVADAIQPRCAVQFAALQGIRGQGLMPYDAHVRRDAMGASENYMITMYVLQRRNAKLGN